MQAKADLVRDSMKNMVCKNTEVLSLLAVLVQTQFTCFVRCTCDSMKNMVCKEHRGAQFTCFASAKVQILTPEELRARRFTTRVLPSFMLTYADVCRRMQTHADVC